MAGATRIACFALAAALSACSRPEPIRVGFVIEIDVYGDAKRPHHMMTVRDGKLSQ